MEFSPEIIRKVARFAKVKLTEAEVEIFNDQFTSITQVINRLQQVDTTGITPINNPSIAQTLMREDKVTDGNYVEDILVNAPKSAFNCFVVPKVIE
ncbi:MAG: Asp-tRNA(Asn)/Glu-tRNA(Gln) amidotransferase subunit GatC [Pseudomonadota bacterium]